ncbi:hypothetical protein [Effusibacillus dendaii]|uniref:Uncharacterized protein n=1 Tax=Effusibacillus dendaii TaxID=2743772 RepID=A0A7I8DD44_9BACL|nr:hypothetical protein [Effusibacillus dendaii]BCJ86869.1 hypothetical protein skT53_18540 [Effusibacillus dendaii]
MATHHHPIPLPEPGPGAKDNGQLAAWLGLTSFTFMMGTFVAANVYLRGWNPQVFGVQLPDEIKNLSYISTLVLIVTTVVLMIAGILFRNSSYKKFLGTMGFGALLYTAYLILQIELCVKYFQAGAAITTINATITIFQIITALVSLGFIAAVGWYGDSQNGKALRRLVPGAMAVWTYAVITGIVVLIITDVVSVGQFADWCGTRLQQLVK